MDVVPSVISSIVRANRRRRTVSSWRRSRAGSVMVRDVAGRRSPSTASMKGAGGVGEQHLSYPRCVQRQPRAGPTDHRYRRTPGDAVDVQHRHAFADRDVHVLIGDCSQILQKGKRRLPQLALRVGEQAQAQIRRPIS